MLIRCLYYFTAKTYRFIHNLKKKEKINWKFYIIYFVFILTVFILKISTLNVSILNISIPIFFFASIKSSYLFEIF